MVMKKILILLVLFLYASLMLIEVSALSTPVVYLLIGVKIVSVLILLFGSFKCFYYSLYVVCVVYSVFPVCNYMRNEDLGLGYLVAMLIFPIIALTILVLFSSRLNGGTG
jgi:hypothetical protein